MKKINKILWIVKTAIKNCFWYILINIIILVISTIFTLLINLINKDIVNELTANISTGYISNLFIGLIITYMILYFLNMANGFLVTFGYNFYRLNVDLLFHKIFMWKSYDTLQEYFLKHDFMEKYSFVSGNTSKISSYLNSIMKFIFSNVGTIIGSMAIFAIYEPLLIIYSAVILILTAIINGTISKKEFELDKKQIKERRFHNYYKDLLTGKASAKELRIYKYRDFIYDKWLKNYNKLITERLGLYLKKIKLRNVSAVVKLILRSLAIGILLIGIYNRKYDVGTFVLLFGLIETCNGQINKVVSLVMSGVYKDIKYLCDYYDFVTPITNEQIRNIRSKKSENSILKYGKFNLLELNNVSFTYPNSEKKAVDNVSLKIRKGEIISILGYNGSGKTTLSKIINGSFSPQTGLVCLNGKNILGEDKKEISKYFGVAPQEFSRFSLQIKELVGLGSIEKMDDINELASAYEKAGINSLISKYSKGDKTILGKQYDEEGVDLSGGEWQRLIISSAYMGDPEILLMDEPTASIDPLKEMEMIENFRENLKGKTAILISHRIGFARLADRILMMENGRITEAGSHKELLEKNGYYAKLFYEQKKLYEEVPTP